MISFSSLNLSLYFVVQQRTAMILAKDENSAQGFEATTMTRDEMDKAQALTIQIFLLLATTLISIGGRVFMRWRRVGLKSFGLDDALAIAGGVSLSRCLLQLVSYRMLIMEVAFLCPKRGLGVPDEHTDTLDGQSILPKE